MAIYLKGIITNRKLLVIKREPKMPTGRIDYQNFIVTFDRLLKLSESPERLEVIASNNKEIVHICEDLSLMAISFEISRENDRKLFIDPVNKTFVRAWREYETRWQSAIHSVAWNDLFEDLVSVKERATKDAFTLGWELADEEARRTAAGIAQAIERAVDSVQDNDNIDEGYIEIIEAAKNDFCRLHKITGVDLRGILRRRALIPSVLIPSHVAKKHGFISGPVESNKLSLKLQLREAQESFIFGLPLAALSHLRAVMELLLTHHYGFIDKELNKKIDRLNYENQRHRLHRLRKLSNDILHSDAPNKKDPLRDKILGDIGTYAALMADFDLINIKKKNIAIKVEREIVIHLMNIRDLLEKAPS